MVQKFPAIGWAARLIMLQISLGPCAWAEDRVNSDESDGADVKAQRNARLAVMRERAEAFEVARVLAGTKDEVPLRKTPVFRYDDQPRGIVDATLWCWEGTGRPVALLKVEAAGPDEASFWQFCVASLADGPVDISFPNGGSLAVDTAGTTLHPFDKAPRPSERSAGRLRQMKELVGRFAGTIHVDGKESLKQEMRCLPRPIHQYSGDSAGLAEGVIFGLTTNGTNPDVLVLIELRQHGEDGLRWEYGIVKMTASDVHIQLDGAEVYSSPKSEPMRKWTFFRMARDAFSREGGRGPERD
jgi:hypothetical protein